MSEAFELFDEAFGLACGVAVGEEVAAEVAIGLAGREHVSDRAEDRVLDGTERALVSAAGLEPPVLRFEVSTDLVTTSPAATGRALKGRQLRLVAGQILWKQRGDREVHYRDWFDRVLAEGHAVGGRDPAASFLTNIRDSPAVVRGSTAGHYRIDPSAIERLETVVREVQAELADLGQQLEAASHQPSEATRETALREHRRVLRQRLRRAEADVDEVRAIAVAPVPDKQKLRAA